VTGNGHQVDKVFVFSTASPHAPPKKVSVEEVGYEVQRLACKAKRRSYNHCSISDAGVAQWLERHVANVNFSLATKPTTEIAVNTTAEKPQEETTPQGLDLSMDVKETSACGRHVTVTIPRTEIERYYTNQFDKISPMAELPGFRIGKAPRNLIEKKFRKQVGDQVKSALLMDSLTQISDADTFSAISEPDLDFHQVNVPEDGDLIFEFNIEVRPDFDLPKWDGIKLTRPEHDFTDKDVEEEVHRIVARFTPAAPVEEAVQAGDVIECNVTSTVDGKTISKEEEVTINVRAKLSLADATIDDFEKLMVGAVADETRTARERRDGWQGSRSRFRSPRSQTRFFGFELCAGAIGHGRRCPSRQHSQFA